MRKYLFLALSVCALLWPSAGGARDFDFTGAAALAGGYNSIWGGYAGADLNASLGIKDYMDVNLDIEALTAGPVSLGASARPKIRFGVGTLYLDAGILYRFVGGGIYDFVSQGSLGWKMKHFEARAGLFSRTMGNFDRNIHSVEERVCEPFNLLYLLQYNLKGSGSSWDVWGGLSNFTPYEYERSWSPIFYVGGRRAVNESLTLFGQAEIKPAGMFHLNASFYGVVCRIGAGYSF